MQQKIFKTQNSEEIFVEIADNFFRRFCGLMGKKNLPARHGLFISPCNSIHMCFMNFPIDAVFLDKDYRIKKIAVNLPTWTGFSFCFGAWGVLEINSGEAENLKLKVGEKICC